MLFLRWILGLFGYNPRGLFRFFDGRRYRRVDPLAVARRLFDDKEFDWDETPELLKTGVVQVQLQAFGTIGNAMRAAFEIEPVDRGGLTDTECLELLARFRGYLGDVKKNGSLFPILPESTESECVVPSPPKPGSDFGSMPIEPFGAPPGLPAEQTDADFPAT